MGGGAEAVGGNFSGDAMLLCQFIMLLHGWLFACYSALTYTNRGKTGLATRIEKSGYPLKWRFFFARIGSASFFALWQGSGGNPSGLPDLPFFSGSPTYPLPCHHVWRRAQGLFTENGVQSCLAQIPVHLCATHLPILNILAFC